MYMYVACRPRIVLDRNCNRPVTGVDRVQNGHGLGTRWYNKRRCYSLHAAPSRCNDIRFPLRSFIEST